MKLSKLFTIPVLVFTLLQAESTLGIDVNNDDVEILTSFDLNKLVNYTNGTDYLLDVNYLHSNSDNMTQVSILGKNYLQGAQNISLAIGLRGVLASDFLTFAFVTKGTYILPLIDSIPTSTLSFQLAYAPEVLSLRDAKNYFEFRAEADMEIISNIHIFTGYREIQTNYQKFDKTFNDHFYLGMKLSF